MLILKRIHVTYRLEASPDADRGTIERVHELHQERCPVARSIHPQVQITTSLDVVEA